MDSSTRTVNHEITIKKFITNYTCRLNTLNVVSTFNRDLKTPTFCLNSAIPTTCYIQFRFDGDSLILIRLVSQPNSLMNIEEPWCEKITINNGKPKPWVNLLPETRSILPEYFDWYSCDCDMYSQIKNDPNGVLTIKCVIAHHCTVVNKNLHDHNVVMKATADDLYDRLEKMFTEKEFADVKINIGDKVFWAHKAILARSPVFAAMFRNQMAEKNESVVNIKDIKPDVFHILMKFLYLGHIELEIAESIATHTLLLGLIVAADKYQIDKLKDTLANLMIRYIDVNNVIDFLLIADEYNVPKIRNESLSFIGEHAKEVRETNAFKKMIKSHTALATEILCFLMDQSVTK